jgi:hypothetical protein
MILQLCITRFYRDRKVQGKQKSMCLAVASANLEHANLKPDRLCQVVLFLQSDGPAIRGDCVTRRKHQVESWSFSPKAVKVTSELTLLTGLALVGTYHDICMSNPLQCS